MSPTLPQVGTPIASTESDRTKLLTDAVALPSSDFRLPGDLESIELDAEAPSRLQWAVARRKT